MSKLQGTGKYSFLLHTWWEQNTQQDFFLLLFFWCVRRGGLTAVISHPKNNQLNITGHHHSPKPPSLRAVSSAMILFLPFPSFTHRRHFYFFFSCWMINIPSPLCMGSKLSGVANVFPISSHPLSATRWKTGINITASGAFRYNAACKRTRQLSHLIMSLHKQRLAHPSNSCP